MNIEYESQVIEVFSQFEKNKSFVLNIEGFSVFENSRTLHLKIGQSAPLETIHQELFTLFNNDLKRKVNKYFISKNAHMTISLTTGKEILYESLQHFMKKDYSEQIEVKQ